MSTEIGAGVEGVENPTPILEVRDLTLTYRRTRLAGKPKEELRALKNVSLKLFAGDIFALVGRSGSGKSSLARSIVLLEKPDSGQIFYQGTNLLSLERAELRRVRQEIQIIFQDSSAALNPGFTVEELLLEPFAIQKTGGSPIERLAAIRELLRQVELPQMSLSRRPLELSGGQRQRVAIARSLALDPRVLVLDEALSALDLSTQGQMANLLLQLREQRGLTYLYITHDLALAAMISGKVAEIAGGCITIGSIVSQGFTANQQESAGGLPLRSASGETVPVS